MSDSDQSDCEYVDTSFVSDDWDFEENGGDFEFENSRPKCSLESGCFCEKLCLPQSVWHKGKLTELRILDPPRVCRRCLASHPGCCLLLNGFCGICSNDAVKTENKPGDKRWPEINKFLADFKTSSLENACQYVIFRELTREGAIEELPIAPLLQFKLKVQWNLNDQANKDAISAAVERRRQIRRVAEREIFDHFRRHRLLRFRRQRHRRNSDHSDEVGVP